MNIITGYRGEAHITADQIRDQNQGCFGDGSYILDVGSKLEATAVSATSVQLSDGIISHQGCTASIPYGSTEAVTISNGTQGMQRIDLIVARYTKDAGTGVEDMSLAVIQGTPAASNPSTPSYNEGSIHAGDSPVDMPLFEVVLDGISIDSVTRVASVVKTQAETDVEISALTASLNDMFMTVDYSTSIGAVSSGQMYKASFNIAQTGYVPIGVLRIQNNHGTFVEIRAFTITESRNTLEVFNYANASQSDLVVHAIVVYAKASFMA